uniref:Uncharacterized protein n=1 Tax=Wuchereria bancrofti TaxID=6293 RepID=A0AAF5RWL3_WUCBA
MIRASWVVHLPAHIENEIEKWYNTVPWYYQELFFTKKKERANKEANLFHLLWRIDITEYHKFLAEA